MKLVEFGMVTLSSRKLELDCTYVTSVTGVTHGRSVTIDRCLISVTSLTGDTSVTIDRCHIGVTIDKCHIGITGVTHDTSVTGMTGGVR